MCIAMHRCAFFAALAIGSTLGAQTSRTDSSGADLLLVGELGRVPSGIRVRVRARTATFEGHVDSLSFVRLVVGGNAGGRIGLTEIDSVWVKQRNTRRFAKRGAYISGLAIAFVMVADWQSNEEYAWGAAFATAIYAGIGYGIGAAIGTASTNWYLRYPRRR